MAFVGGVLWWIVLGALLGWLAAWWLGRSSQRLLTDPVIRIVERKVDNPQHIARISALETEAATIPALVARIEELQAAPPRVVEKVVTRTLDRVIEKPVERIVEKPVDRVVERLVPDVRGIEERDAALRAQRLRVVHLEALAAVLADRVASRGAPAPAPAPAATGARPESAPPDAAALRTLRLRIEHLEALAAVQADRLGETRVAAEAKQQAATGQGSPGALRKGIDGDGGPLQIPLFAGRE
jgi:hypothetical protein